jgi:hypothetical protein
MQDENSVLQLWSIQRRKEENQLVHSFGEETNSNDNNKNSNIYVYDSQHACKKYLQWGGFITIQDKPT